MYNTCIRTFLYTYVYNMGLKLNFLSFAGSNKLKDLVQIYTKLGHDFVPRSFKHPPGGLHLRHIFARSLAVVRMTFTSFGRADFLCANHR